MQYLAISLVFHQRDDPLRGQVINRLETRARVRTLNRDCFHVKLNFTFFVDNGLGKECLFVSLECELVLFARVAILRLKLAHLLKGKHRHFHLAQSNVGLALPIETLNVGWVELGCLASVKQSQLVLLELEAGERAIAVKNGFLLGRDLAEDSLSVLFGRLLELLGCTQKANYESEKALHLQMALLLTLE